MKTIFITVMVIILKVPFWKLLDISYVKISYSTITRHINNGIWKTPYSWRFYGHGSTYVLILSWVNVMKRKWVKVSKKLSVAQNSEPALRRTLDQDISLIRASHSGGWGGGHGGLTSPSCDFFWKPPHQKWCPPPSYRVPPT